MRIISSLLAVAVLFFSVAHAQSSDTLLDVRQWTVAAGGNDHYYGIIPIVQPWVYQNALAQTLSYAGESGYLATITSAAENTFIESLMADHTDQPSITDEFYIGGLKVGGSWTWVSGEQFLYTNWASGEPSGDGPALAIWGMSQGSKAGKWNDAPEDTVGHTSIHQLWAVIEFGPTEGGDSLINLTQWTVADGGNDHWYAVLATEHNWTAASFLAGLFVQGQNLGYLATIESPEENQFIVDNLIAGTSQPSSVDNFWLGGSLSGSPLEFNWETGEVFSYTNWAPDQPDGNTDKAALAMFGFSAPGETAGTWNNAYPDGSISATDQWWSIVEFGPITEPPVDTLLDVRQWTAAEGGNDHYYGIIPIVQPWVNQLELATTLTYNSQPGYLATIRSAAENAFVTSIIFDHPDQPSVADEFFLGASDLSGSWQWETGESFAYAHWATGEPNDNGHAMAMWGSSEGSRAGYWNDVPEDTTGYGTYPQLWAVIEFGPLDSSVVDTLIDVRQWTVAEGGNDHYYGIISLVQPWVNQLSLATTLTYNSQPGYLVTIRSAAENAFVESLIFDHPDQPSVADEFFIGASDLGGPWHWETGEPFTYAHWAAGEPNGNGHALAMWGGSEGLRAGYWNDVPEDTTGYGTYPQLWAVIEFGPLDSFVIDTLIDVRQWTAAEGGNDHYYGIISIVQPWVDQRDLALTLVYDNKPGYLACINSAAENTFLESLMADHTDQPSVTDEFYIGGSRATGPWAWLSGEPFVYTHWEFGEPSGDGTSLAIWGMSQGIMAGYWNDVPADSAGLGWTQQLWALVEFGGPCCSGLTGNVNGDPSGLVNLSDLSLLVNHLFVTMQPLPCRAAANTSGDAGCVISLTDVTLLVNHLFVTFEQLAPCNPACEQ